MPDFLNGSMRGYLDQLASGAPVPGGGSAAALSGAMGAALLSMSAHFTVGREKYAAFEAQASAVLAEAEALRPTLQQLVEDDAAAYAQYGAAMALPRVTDEEKAARKAAIQHATRESAKVPLEIARKCYRLLEMAGVLAEQCNPNLVSDVAVATHLALAGFRSALLNVRINLKYLDDADFVRRAEAELDPLVRRAPVLAQQALASSYRVMELPLEGDIPA